MTTITIDRALLERVFHLVSGLQDARFQFVVPALREALQSNPVELHQIKTEQAKPVEPDHD